MYLDKAMISDVLVVESLALGIDKMKLQIVDLLKKVLAEVSGNAKDAAAYYHDVVIPAMDAVRAEADKLEMLTDKSCWPYPTYSDLLYY